MNKADLNLLPVLETLLEELNVTAAAKRLNLSQSAVSKHLARLREMFADPLFERTAQGLKATPRAIELAPQLRQLLQQLAQITRPLAFDPAVSQRRFNIHLLETAYSLTFPFFMPDLLAQAPNIGLKTQTWDQNSLNILQKCEIDMAITCREWDERSALHMRHLPDTLNRIELLRDHPVCLLRQDHPALKQPWNLATFLHYRHLQVTFGGHEHWLLDDVLAMENHSRDIAVNMPDFHSAMSLCEQSDLILCVPSRHAAKMAGFFRLRSLEVPVKLEPGAYVLLWHHHFDQDPGHRWLRELIASSVN